MLKQNNGLPFYIAARGLDSEWSITPDKNLKTPRQLLVKTVNPGKIAQMYGKYVHIKTNCFQFHIHIPVGSFMHVPNQRWVRVRRISVKALPVIPKSTFKITKSVRNF